MRCEEIKARGFSGSLVLKQTQLALTSVHPGPVGPQLSNTTAGKRRIALQIVAPLIVEYQIQSDRFFITVNAQTH